MRIGPKMQWAIEIIRNNPGITPMEVAAEVGPHGSLQYGYAVVYRCLSSGLVKRVEREDKRRCYRLYAA